MWGPLGDSRAEQWRILKARMVRNDQASLCIEDPTLTHYVYLHNLMYVGRRKLYTFAIDPDLAHALKQVKARDGVAESEQVRRALRTWFERRGVLKPERKRTATRRRS